METTSAPRRPTLPVGKIVCVGRNYAEHAAEMGVDRPTSPLLFLKPSTALHQGESDVALPRFSSDIHHEVEMVVRLGRPGKDLAPDAALASIDAVAIGLDLTARDLQAAAKKAGQPWAIAKGFDGAAPISALHAVDDPRTLGALDLALEVNGVVRQLGNTKDFLFPLGPLLAFISSRFRFEAGDLVFTGTPSGVGPLRPGDHARATLGPLSPWEIRFC